MFSLIVPVNSTLFCGTTARCFLYEWRFIFVISCPSTVTVPELGKINPRTRFMSVDLPEPDSPTIAIVSPAFT